VCGCTRNNDAIKDLVHPTFSLVENQTNKHPSFMTVENQSPKVNNNDDVEGHDFLGKKNIYW